MEGQQELATGASRTLTKYTLCKDRLDQRHLVPIGNSGVQKGPEMVVRPCRSEDAGLQPCGDVEHRVHSRKGPSSSGVGERGDLAAEPAGRT